MVSRKSFLLGILMVVLIPGCTSTISERKPEEKIKETVVSEPHGADIYWGKTQSNLEKTGYKTPYSRSISAKAWESWCYQVKKEGYYDSEAICSDKTSGNRYVHFELKPLKTSIASDPQGADIYWGPSRDKMVKTGHKTPLTVDSASSGAGYKDWYYKAGKAGFRDSQVLFRARTSSDRYVHFELERKLQHSVVLTGAATALKRITAGGAFEKRPRLSPDKRWLLIQASGFGPKAANNSILQKIDLVLGSRVILTLGSSDSREGDWLPDGSAIVFASDKLTEYTIVQSLGTAGETAVKFISHPAIGSARYPNVSPDGKNVAFSIFLSRIKNQICVMGLDGSDLRVYGEGWEPTWSPDSKKLIFTRKVGDFTHIYAMDVQTGANLVELCATKANDFCPTWSPDGKSIAFISDRVRDRQHLFVTGADGQVVVQLTDEYFDIDSASWGSDGSIYFSANAGGNWDIWKLKPKFQ